MNSQRRKKGFETFMDRPFCSLQALNIQPYMYEPESEPENEDEPPEQQQDVPVGNKCGKCGKIPAEAGNVCCLHPGKVFESNIGLDYSDPDIDFPGFLKPG